MTDITFEPWPKMARLTRECIITEKLDGTNAQVIITEDGRIGAASRTRLITPTDDNYGFARWVEENRDALLTLGPGRHFGEWWGQKIQRGYGLTEKRFSLFNTSRWTGDNTPGCCHIVPVLYRGLFSEAAVNDTLDLLRVVGSQAVPFMNPEGIVIYHTASGTMFKKTLEGDEYRKGQHANRLSATSGATSGAVKTSG